MSSDDLEVFLKTFSRKKTLAAETNAYPWRSLGGKFDEAYYKCDSSDYICLYINEMDNQQWYKEQERELGLFCYYKILTISKKKKIKILTWSMKLPLSVTTYSKGDLD